MKKPVQLLETLSKVSAESYLTVITNLTFADLESGDVLDYVNPDNTEDNGRAIFLCYEESKFGKLAKIIWTDTFDTDYILGITRIDGRQWKFAFK
jgi:hypothetical protein